MYSSKRWEGERERKGSSALRERGSEKHKRRDPSAGKKAIKIVSLFFWLPHFFLRSLFFGKEGAGKGKKKGPGGGVMVVEREAKKPPPTQPTTRGGGR